MELNHRNTAVEDDAKVKRDKLLSKLAACLFFSGSGLIRVAHDFAL